MLKDLYARWMFAWETALTTRDTNRVVRPLEWGFDWLRDFAEPRGLMPPPHLWSDLTEAASAMRAVNAAILRDSDSFYGYQPPASFQLEERPPLLFPTNVRRETRPNAGGAIPALRFSRAHLAP
jgi:hypothetical protein